MKQSLLIIGSILTSCILILVSLSSVVSINTIEQTNIPTSPLFDTRINSALKSQPTTSISTSYIGKDAINDVWFPKTTHIGVLLQKAYSIAKDLRNYLKNIKDVRSVSDTEVFSLMVSYLRTQKMFKNVNEGYLQALLSRHLQSTQHFGQNLMDEHSDSVVGFTAELTCWWEFLNILFILIAIPIISLLALLFPGPELKCRWYL